MTERVQEWLLANTKGLQHLINDKLAKRSGAIGRFFKMFEIGPRQMGSHTVPKFLKLANYHYMNLFYVVSNQRIPFSRYLTGNLYGPMNLSGLFGSFVFSCLILSLFKFERPMESL